MKKLLFAALLLLAALASGLAEPAAAQLPIGDSCLTSNWNGFSKNPDSIYVDTS